MASTFVPGERYKDEYKYEDSQEANSRKKWDGVIEALRYFKLPAETDEDRKRVLDSEFWEGFNKELKKRVVAAHPQKNPNDPRAGEKFNKIHSYRDLLTDFHLGRIEIPSWYGAASARGASAGTTCKGCPDCSSSKYDVEMRAPTNPPPPPTPEENARYAAEVASARQKQRGTPSSTPQDSRKSPFTGATAGPSSGGEFVYVYDERYFGDSRKFESRDLPTVTPVYVSPPSRNAIPVHQGTGRRGPERRVLGEIVLEFGKKSNPKKVSPQGERPRGGEQSGGSRLSGHGPSRSTDSGRTGGASKAESAEAAAQVKESTPRKSGDRKPKKPVFVRPRNNPTEKRVERR